MHCGVAVAENDSVCLVETALGAGEVGVWGADRSGECKDVERGEEEEQGGKMEEEGHSWCLDWVLHGLVN